MTCLTKNEINANSAANPHSYFASSSEMQMVTWTHKPMILTRLVCQHCWKNRTDLIPPGGYHGTASTLLWCDCFVFLTEGRARQDKVLLFFDSQSLGHSLAFSRCSINVEQANEKRLKKLIQ